MSHVNLQLSTLIGFRYLQRICNREGAIWVQTGGAVREGTAANFYLNEVQKANFRAIKQVLVAVLLWADRNFMSRSGPKTPFKAPGASSLGCLVISKRLDPSSPSPSCFRTNVPLFQGSFKT